MRHVLALLMARTMRRITITRFIAALVLGATMTLTTAAVFAENNSAIDRQPSRNQVKQPVAIALDVAVVPGAPGQYNGPWYIWRLDNRDSRAGR